MAVTRVFPFRFEIAFSMLFYECCRIVQMQPRNSSWFSFSSMDVWIPLIEQFLDKSFFLKGVLVGISLKGLHHQKAILKSDLLMYCTKGSAQYW